ncbi:hypothetical protein UCREL1_8251 [Eutypa lata UCREL1]|uniref:Acid phosphatase-like protein n=1 Tax=Eutypa lata (strain UCR-EL1) TaxID=1287681 RepID=M7SKS5_EUTLA|nr:hypothetical protein UCREL1_8251 [Eutypa lata UCREL1]
MVYLNWRDAAGEVLQPRQDDPAQDTSTEDDTTRKVSPVGTFFIVLFVLLLVGGVGWVVFTQLRARRLGLPAPSWSSYNPFSGSDRSSPYGPPTPAPGGIRGWFSDKFSALRGSGSGNRNARSAAGAYERRGFGPLDPDEAWDARVGHEAELGGYTAGYDQELGSSGIHNNNGNARYGGGGGAATAGGGGGGFGGAGSGRGFDGADTPYSGGGYDMNLAADDDHDDHGHERGRTRSRSPAAAGLTVNTGGGHNPFDDDAEPSNVSLRGVSPRPIDTGAAAAMRKQGHGPGGSPTSERRSIFRENV